MPVNWFTRVHVRCSKLWYKSRETTQREPRTKESSSAHPSPSPSSVNPSVLPVTLLWASAPWHGVDVSTHNIHNWYSENHPQRLQLLLISLTVGREEEKEEKRQATQRTTNGSLVVVRHLIRTTVPEALGSGQGSRALGCRPPRHLRTVIGSPHCGRMQRINATAVHAWAVGAAHWLPMHGRQLVLGRLTPSMCKQQKICFLALHPLFFSNWY